MSVEEELNQSVAYTPIQRMRHSAAHVMAEAVQDLFLMPDLLLVRPSRMASTTTWKLPRPLTPEDLPAIEQRMRGASPTTIPLSIANGRAKKRSRIFSRARSAIQSRDHREPARCRGRHLSAGAFPGPVPWTACRTHGSTRRSQVMRVAGAYWRGDEHRPMLQRLYGTAWFSHKPNLDAYLERLEEAKRRDHRKLGKDLESVYGQRRDWRRPAALAAQRGNGAPSARGLYPGRRARSRAISTSTRRIWQSLTCIRRRGIGNTTTTPCIRRWRWRAAKSWCCAR